MPMFLQESTNPSFGMQDVVFAKWEHKFNSHTLFPHVTFLPWTVMSSVTSHITPCREKHHQQFTSFCLSLVIHLNPKFLMKYICYDGLSSLGHHHLYPYQSVCSGCSSDSPLITLVWYQCTPHSSWTDAIRMLHVFGWHCILSLIWLMTLIKWL